jgi:hypothetical protein
LEIIVSNFESTNENKLRTEAEECSIQVKNFLKKVVGLRSEAGTAMVEGSQAVQDAELALFQLEGWFNSNWWCHGTY